MILSQVYHPILMQVSYIPNKYFKFCYVTGALTLFIDI